MDLRLKLIFASGAALLVLSTVGVFSYRSAKQSDQDQYWVMHTDEVIEELDSLDLNLKPPARPGQVRNDIATLTTLTADNPVQQRQLKRLQDLISAPSLTKTGPATQNAGAERLARQAAAVTSQMRDEENRLRDVRVSAAKASARQVKFVIVLGDALTVLFVFVAAQMVRHEMARRTKTEALLRLKEEQFRLMSASVKEYAILNLDPLGYVTSWNIGAERIKGYRADEIVGQHFSQFYPPDDVAAGKTRRELETAARDGQCEDEGWRVRRDGSRFWANVVITAVRGKDGALLGFCKVSRDLTEERRTQEALQLKNAQLEAANKELDAFSYSVAHDLRAPLRAIDGFSQALVEDLKDQLPDEDRIYLQRVRGGVARMAELIDDLLKLARISRYEVQKKEIDLSGLAGEVSSQLQASEKNGRQVEFAIKPGLRAVGDRELLRIVFENLMGNAWKFTSKKPSARIEFGVQNGGGEQVFFVRDNGPGFDMQYANKLFGVFQRLHRENEFPGTGVGLATVQRIIHRHGGRIWTQAAVGKGATFYFVL